MRRQISNLSVQIFVHPAQPCSGRKNVKTVMLKHSRRWTTRRNTNHTILEENSAEKSRKKHGQVADFAVRKTHVA
jgi:hypothetical protein